MVSLSLRQPNFLALQQQSKAQTPPKDTEHRDEDLEHKHVSGGQTAALTAGFLKKTKLNKLITDF